MSTPSASWPAERHAPEETRQAFIEDTKDLLAELRDFLELPAAARKEQGRRTTVALAEQPVSSRTDGVHAHTLYSG